MSKNLKYDIAHANRTKLPYFNQKLFSLFIENSVLDKIK